MKVFIVLLLVTAAVESITAQSRNDCDLPPETGPCKGYFPRYYYDPKTNNCKKFIYGGCGGNRNNFWTQEECQGKCRVICGENAQYESCGTCERTCDNYKGPPQVCAAVCVQGCRCKKGFVRTESGDCVKPEECPVTGNPTLRDCNKLPETGPCEGYALRYYYDRFTDTCNLFIYGGCGGNKNNFKTEEECYQKCRVQCEENAHYEDCGTACPLTCENYENPPDFCPAICRSGCQCDEGFVQTESGRCVKPEDCPVPEICGENAQYESCGTLCPLTCENYENPPQVCAAVCVQGCQCKKGFVRTKNGGCVKPEECPVTGNTTLSRNDCSKVPETGLCRARFIRYYYDPLTDRCGKFIYGGCGGNKNNFKTEEECYHKCRDCPPNKEYGSFGDCPDSCYSLDDPERPCTLRLNFGCKCKPGYVLKEDKVFDSDCIKPEECPLDE